MVMSRMRQTIKRKSMQPKIDLDFMSEEVLMSDSMNDVVKLQMELLKFSSAASLGHKSKTEATLEKKWTTGDDYKDSNSKSRAKARLLSELELVSGKELAKAQSVFSSVSSELSIGPSFDELYILSSDTR